MLSPKGATSSNQSSPQIRAASAPAEVIRLRTIGGKIRRTSVSVLDLSALEATHPWRSQEGPDSFSSQNPSKVRQPTTLPELLDSLERGPLGLQLAAMDAKLTRMERAQAQAFGGCVCGPPWRPPQPEPPVACSLEVPGPPGDTTISAANATPEATPTFEDPVPTVDSFAEGLDGLMPTCEDPISRQRTPRTPPDGCFPVTRDISHRSLHSAKSADVFTVREAWLEESQHPVDEVMGEAYFSERSQPGGFGSIGFSRFQTEGARMVGGCVLHPSSAQRFIWDLMSVLLILYDTVTLPVMLAFMDGDSDWSRGVFWFALCFWTMDIPLSFITGYFNDGTEEVELPLIIKRYLRTWFLFDIFLVGSDWFGVILGERHKGVALVRVGKTLRILRTLRSLRLLRLMKLRRILHNVQDRFLTANFHLMADVLKGTILILSLNHFLACSWYGLGYSSIPADEGSTPGWVEIQGLEQRDLNERYFVSLHWSMSQVSPADTDVGPISVSERIFATVVALLGLMAFTFYIASITAAMTSIKSSTSNENFSLLRRFLRGRGIPTEVSMRVIRYVEHQVQLQKRQIQEKDVHLLRLLSEPLRMELAKHTYQPVLIRHPFFRYYAHADPEAIKNICATALTTARYSAGDTVFTEGRSQDCMMFLLRGRARYTPKKQRSFSKKQTQQNSVVARFKELQRWNTTQLLEDLTMEEGDWCSEAALWTRWAHVGSMRALVDSEILLLDSTAFAEVTSAHRKVTRAAASYGQGLVERLNFGIGEGLLSDLPRVSSVEWEELASAAFACGPYKAASVDFAKIGMIRRTGTILGLGMDPLKWLKPAS